MVTTENIQPRRQLLEIWTSAAGYSQNERKWRWGGLREPNSISDAEQLLCFLQPATELDVLRLELPDDTAVDALRSLTAFGDSVQIPRVLTQAVEQYLDAYTVDGTPQFGGGSSVVAIDPNTALTDKQRETDLLVSYATSVSLCLSALGFLDVYSNAPTTKGQWRNRVLDIKERVSMRLTAALVGLLRGFTINTLEAGSTEGRNLLSLLNQERLPERRIVDHFTERMETVRGRLSEARMGVSRAEELDNPNLLFEAGWTWGVAEDAPRITYDDGSEIGVQADGVALSAPYLYSTLVALDAVEQLTDDRTRVLGLLNPQQERLANNLDTRRNLVQLYYSRLALFDPVGGGKWPVEDLPWLTPDGVESDYFSLLICAVLIKDLRDRRGSEDNVRRIAPLLSELANRSRITRRPTREDPALSVHAPGLLNPLDGSEVLGPPMALRITDFAPLLLKRTTQLASLTNNSEVRDEMLALSSDIWNHLVTRRITDPAAAGLWDDASKAFPQLGAGQRLPSWNVTQNVVDALVTSASTLVRRQTRAPILSQTAAAMVSEAEYLLNQQLMSTPSLNSGLQSSLMEIRESLTRAGDLVEEQPSTAIALCVAAVTELDKNVLARQDATGQQGL
ncbi:MAG: SCO2524 family protein [Actinocrinis sp.]